MNLLRAFPAMMRIGFAEAVAYRAEMVVWVLATTLPLVMLGLWNAAAEGGPVGGYDQIAFTRYFVVILVVRHLTSVWLVWEVNWMIRTGSLSPWLLRPVSFLWWNLAQTLGGWPLRVLVVLPLIAGIALWRPEIAWTPGPVALLAGAVSVLLALAAQYLVQCIFGALSFFLDQSVGLYNAWFAVWALLSGYALPVSLLPGWAQTLAVWLPFRATLGAPVSILLGEAPILPTLLFQLGWIAALALLARLTWEAGVRRYGAFGA